MVPHMSPQPVTPSWESQIWPPFERNHPGSEIELSLNLSKVEDLPLDWSGFNTEYLRLFAGEITSPMDEALDILPLFTEVTYLQIYGWDFQKFNSDSIEHLFGSFYKTVTALMLVDCRVNSEVLIHLTSRFTLVESLWVQPRDTNDQTYKFERRCDSPLVNPEFKGFQGNLVIGTLTEEHERFLEFVNGRSSKLRSIQVSKCQNHGQLQKLFEVERPDLTSISIEAVRPAISLESCTALQTLWIRPVGKGLVSYDPSWKILSTITPGRLEEINIHSILGGKRGGTREQWGEIDDYLCELEARVTLLPYWVDANSDPLMGYVEEVLPKTCGIEGCVTLSMDG